MPIWESMGGHNYLLDALVARWMWGIGCQSFVGSSTIRILLLIRRHFLYQLRAQMSGLDIWHCLTKWQGSGFWQFFLLNSMYIMFRQMSDLANWVSLDILSPGCLYGRKNSKDSFLFLLECLLSILNHFLVPVHYEIKQQIWLNKAECGDIMTQSIFSQILMKDTP